MSQKQQILDWLKIGPITAAFAIEHGIYRSAARVHELRQEGHNIRTDKEPNRNASYHAKYSLMK